MNFESKRTKEEVDALESRLLNGSLAGSKYPGMTYEDGALDILKFLDGRIEANEVYEED